MAKKEKKEAPQKPNLKQERVRFGEFMAMGGGEGDSFGEILKEFVKRGGDDRLRTEIETPVELTILKNAESYLKKKGLTRSASIIKTMVENYTAFMFSYKRKSRTELLDGVKAYMMREAMKQEERDMAERLTAPPGG